MSDDEDRMHYEADVNRISDTPPTGVEKRPGDDNPPEVKGKTDAVTDSDTGPSGEEPDDIKGVITDMIACYDDVNCDMLDAVPLFSYLLECGMSIEHISKRVMQGYEDRYPGKDRVDDVDPEEEVSDEEPQPEKTAPPEYDETATPTADGDVLDPVEVQKAVPKAVQDRQRQQMKLAKTNITFPPSNQPAVSYGFPVKRFPLMKGGADDPCGDIDAVSVEIDKIIDSSKDEDENVRAGEAINGILGLASRVTCVLSLNDKKLQVKRIVLRSFLTFTLLAGTAAAIVGMVMLIPVGGLGVELLVISLILLAALALSSGVLALGSVHYLASAVKAYQKNRARPVSNFESWKEGFITRMREIPPALAVAISGLKRLLTFEGEVNDRVLELLSHALANGFARRIETATEPAALKLDTPSTRKASDVAWALYTLNDNHAGAPLLSAYLDAFRKKSVVNVKTPGDELNEELDKLIKWSDDDFVKVLDEFRFIRRGSTSMFKSVAAAFTGAKAWDPGFATGNRSWPTVHNMLLSVVTHAAQVLLVHQLFPYQPTDVLKVVEGFYTVKKHVVQWGTLEKFIRECKSYTHHHREALRNYIDDKDNPLYTDIRARDTEVLKVNNSPDLFWGGEVILLNSVGGFNQPLNAIVPTKRSITEHDRVAFMEYMKEDSLSQLVQFAAAFDCSSFGVPYDNILTKANFEAAINLVSFGGGGGSQTAEAEASGDDPVDIPQCCLCTDQLQEKNETGTYYGMSYMCKTFNKQQNTCTTCSIVSSKAYINKIFICACRGGDNKIKCLTADAVKDFVMGFAGDCPSLSELEDPHLRNNILQLHHMDSPYNTTVEGRYWAAGADIFDKILSDEIAIEGDLVIFRTMSVLIKLMETAEAINQKPEGMSGWMVRLLAVLPGLLIAFDAAGKNELDVPDNVHIVWLLRRIFMYNSTSWECMQAVTGYINNNPNILRYYSLNAVGKPPATEAHPPPVTAIPLTEHLSQNVVWRTLFGDDLGTDGLARLGTDGVRTMTKPYLTASSKAGLLRIAGSVQDRHNNLMDWNLFDTGSIIDICTHAMTPINNDVTKFLENVRERVRLLHSAFEASKVPRDGAQLTIVAALGNLHSLLLYQDPVTDPVNADTLALACEIMVFMTDMRRFFFNYRKIYRNDGYTESLFDSAGGKWIQAYSAYEMSVVIEPDINTAFDAAHWPDLASASVAKNIMKRLLSGNVKVHPQPPGHLPPLSAPPPAPQLRTGGGKPMQKRVMSSVFLVSVCALMQLFA